MTRPASGGTAGPGRPHAPWPGTHIAAPTARLILTPDAPEAAWHATRLLGLGGSDIAAVLGLDRYRSPWHVWRDKQGHHDFVDSEAAYWGRKLEAMIAEGFADQTGLTLLDTPGTLQHIGHSWALANVDRLVVAPDVDHPQNETIVAGPLECKNRSEHQAGDWDEGVPDSPALQATWYQAVGGWPEAWVAALIGGNRLRWHHLERDEELIEHLFDYCGRWWQRHVVEGVQPDPDGSAATTELLAHLWDAKPEAVAEVDGLTAEALLHRRRELKSGLDDIEDELATVENQLKVLLGKNEIATIGGRRAYSWKANGTFRAADFRTEQPALAAEYVRLVEGVDTDRLAVDHPDIHRRYRARRLFVPKEGKAS